MSDDLKNFQAVYADRTVKGGRIVTVVFSTDDETDAPEIARDIALLEDYQLLYYQEAR